MPADSDTAMVDVHKSVSMWA